MHANTENEYLTKVKEMDAQAEIVELDLHSELDGFVVNANFTFESIGSQPLLQIEQVRTFKQHRILMMADDLKLTPRRLQLIIEQQKADNFDTITQSTNEEQTPLSSYVLKLDCMTHHVLDQDTQHCFEIWIQNTQTPHELFEKIYYKEFQAFIFIQSCMGINNQQLETLKQINPNIQCYCIREDEEYSPDRKMHIQTMNLHSVFKSLSQL